MSDWNFPSNGGGQVRGIADAGISTFTGKEISSLARDFKTADVPDCDEYRKILCKCRDFLQDIDKARIFFDALRQSARQHA